jgi:prepilin-type N-terminal cleavage/methylation domain-containing protein
MSTAGYSRFGTKIRKPEGFTLIEVIVAIAILSIISVALMQMFAVSARSNGKTYAMDKANALCTETAEHFKADPGFPGAAESGFNKLPPSETVTGTVYTRYLDRDFVYTEGSVPTGDSVHELDVTVTTTPAATTTAFYYPDAAFSYDLTGDINITLNLTGSALVVSVGGNDTPVDTGKIIYTADTASSTEASTTSGSALIPLHLNCKVMITSSAEVKIENNVKTVLNEGEEYTAVADIYLCDVPPGATVTVKAGEGAVASQSSPVSTVGSENIMYTAGIKITKLLDGSVLAENSVEKYWVN